MDKVKLTKAQAWHLENLREHHSKRDIVAIAINDPGSTAHVKGGINSIDHDTLIRALYVGYEVEQTVEEKLLEAYRAALPYQAAPDVQSAYREGVKKACEIAEIAVKWARN
ncbi:hypothetical protein [Paenibacillus sp. S29]|uniref:hypothetical protein n=1 Tax=Paenibacillus sp. S29 TaxID=3394611 RepID=UPI0039BFD929